jgi:hypothetical protein
MAETDSLAAWARRERVDLGGDRRRSAYRATSRTGDELKLRLYERYQDLLAAARRRGWRANLPMPSDVQNALDLYLAAEPRGHRVEPDRRIRATLRFPTRTYRIDTTNRAAYGRLLIVWQRRPKFLDVRPGAWRILEIGIFHGFGELLSPRVTENARTLGRRFHVPATRVRYLLRKFRDATRGLPKG